MNHSTVQMIKVRCWTQMKVGIVLQQTKASIIAVKVTVRWFLPCAWKDKSNPASHHSSPLSSAIPSASLADMRKIQCANQRITSQQEFVIESLKCLSAKNFINKQSAGSVWEYHPSKDGRMLHVRRGKQTLCSLRGVLVRPYLWVCVCVLDQVWRGYGWACTDRFLRLLVASSGQKPWFTTEQWSDTHSSMREPDRHYCSACTPASTNTPTQTQEGRLWCSALRLFLLFQRWRRERNSEKKVTCVKPNAAKVVSVRAVYMQNKNLKTATLSRDIFI